MYPIFSYIDYRKFLKDYYNYEKKRIKNFSFRFFSQQADIKSPVFLKEVYDGKKDLSLKMIRKFCAALKFKKREATYFRNLVHFNQAKTAEEKQEFYIVLRSMADMVDQHVLKTGFFEFYDKWYTCVIRELITQNNFKNDYELLANSVYPSITVPQAKKSVQVLLRLGLIKVQHDGTYVQTEKDITSGSEVDSLIIRNHNRKMVELARNAVVNLPVNQRYCKGITMGITREYYDLIVAETELYKDRILSIANSCKEPDEVYELYLQVFPLGKKVKKKEGGE